MVKKTKRTKEPLSIAKIDYVGYNAIMATQLLIEQLRQMRLELLEIKKLTAHTQAKLDHYVSGEYLHRKVQAEAAKGDLE